MKRMTNEEVKAVELNILKYVYNVCKKNHLQCFLSGGTLIGAVRHKGFIPWDDDIDIMMPRPDYDKLVDILKDDPKYKMLTIHLNRDYYYIFGKIVDTATFLDEKEINIGLKELGVYVDVFPLEGLPSKYEDCRKHMKKMKMLRDIRWMALHDEFTYDPKGKYFGKLKYCILYIIWKAAKLYGWRKISLKAEKFAMKYPFDYSDHAGCVVSGYREKEICSKKSFLSSVDVEFEGEIFSAPIGYDEYLTNLYGDYMKLPPKEKQVTHHDFEAYWR